MAGKAKAARAATHALLALGSVLMVFPFVWMLFTSLKSPSEILQVPPTFFPRRIDPGNYQAVLSIQMFSRYILNSFIISAISVASVLLSSMVAGYTFAKFKFPLRNLLFTVILATAIMPFEVYMVSIYLTIRSLHLFDTYLGIAFPILIMSFGIFFIRQFALSVPDELLDAARIDGASEPWILLRVAVPLCVSPLLALAIFTFTDAWGFFIWPLVVINSKEMFTVDLGLNIFHRKFYVNHGPVAAGAVVAILPLLVVFAVLRRRFMEGIALTGIKA